MFIVLSVFVLATSAMAVFRFPMPEFETGYTFPEMYTPQPPNQFGVLDVCVLFVCLSLSSWLVLKERSRRGIFLLTIFSILYFGFWRNGCVCAVGSLQNVVLAIFDSEVGVSGVVIAFFLLPLVFALFFGRVFCASVCPLGAVQEVVAVRPVEVPKPIDKFLGIFPYLYLGLTFLALLTGAGFLICRYDPYVGFFRRGANFNMLVTGGVLLAVGVFIGRPYCRYLCPYGVLLDWMARFSKHKVSITPTDCIQCRLCEDSCPYGAINTPTTNGPPEGRKEGSKRVYTLLLVLPVVVIICAVTGMLMHDVLSRLHHSVRLAERIAGEEKGFYDIPSVESEAFRKSTTTIEELYEKARTIKADYKFGGVLLGAFMGFVICFKLIGLSVVRKREDYEPDRGACVSCGRCYAYCPVEEGLTKDQIE